MVELFAGLRTGHVAADMISGLDYHFRIVHAHAAECCAFANTLAKKNKVNERLSTDVKTLDNNWATNFVEIAKTQKAEVILIIEGFPCKGLSRQGGKNTPNLRDGHSALFEEIPRIGESLKQAAHGTPEVKIIVENVIMDQKPERYITDKFQCRPLLVNATAFCGASSNEWQRGWSRVEENRQGSRAGWIACIISTPDGLQNRQTVQDMAEG